MRLSCSISMAGIGPLLRLRTAEDETEKSHQLGIGFQLGGRTPRMGAGQIVVTICERKTWTLKRLCQ